MKRWLSLLLSVLMLVSMLPMSAIVTSAETTDEIEYTEVRTVEDLYMINFDLAGNYKLMNDIDLSVVTAEGGDYDYYGNGWAPIGSGGNYSNNEFTGVFDGNGYSIIGMRIDVTSDKVPGDISENVYAGLFAKNAGYIHHLTMKDVNIMEVYAPNYSRVGAIVGTNTNDGVIEYCSVSGSIVVTNKYNQLGGIAGSNGGEIKFCYNAASVEGKYYSGGIAGISSGQISNCYNRGRVFGTGVVGGIVGGNASTSGKGTVTCCYNIAKTSGNAITDNSGSVSNSYYISSSGSNSTGALTDDEARDFVSYSGFDFYSDWYMNCDGVYPYPQIRGMEEDVRVVTDCEIYSMPKTTFLKREEFTTSGLVVKFEFENDPTEYIEITEDMVTGHNTNKVGTYTVKFSYYYRKFDYEIIVDELPFKEIYSVEDLKNVANDLSANYILMNDIDVTDQMSSSLGSFSGIFDGNGYEIIGKKRALFTTVTGTVKNLGMTGATFESRGAFTIGSIANELNSGTIENCYNSNNYDLTLYKPSSTYPYSNVGGLVGYAIDSNISKCYNTGTIRGEVPLDSTFTYTSYVGGIFGKAVNTTVSDCYNTGKIIGTYGSNACGGACGIGNLDSGSITRCYNTSYITHAIIDLRSGKRDITNCYYLEPIYITETGATKLTEAQMKQKKSFVGFDFENVWIIDEATNYKYPQLRTNRQDNDRLVKKVSIKTLPAKDNYYTTENIDVTGGVLTIRYIDESVEEIPITPDMVPQEALSEIGVIEVPVVYKDFTCTYYITVSEKPNLVSLELISTPNKTEFIKDTEFDFSGAKALAFYDNNTTEIIDISANMTTGGNISSTGKQTIVYELEGKSVQFDVEVVADRMTSIKVAKLPLKTNYIQKEKFESAGLKIVANYISGKEKEIIGYTLTGFDSTKVGTNTITVSYGAYTDTFDVTIMPKTAVSIEITSKPSKIQYVQGEKFDTTGMVVVATYNNGDVEEVSDYTVGEVGDTLGYKQLEISYQGKTAYVTIKVNERMMVGVVVTSLPYKLKYIEGESFDSKGIEVSAVYNDGSKEIVTDYTISGVDTKTPGEKRVAVVYKDKYASFTINVVEKSAVRMTVTEPAKKVYVVGETFDTSGMIVTVYYDNGTSEEVNDYTVEGFTGTLGDNLITVKYGAFSEYIIVEVVEEVAVLTDISIVSLPNKLEYKVGEQLNPNGLIVVGVYSNGTVEPITDYEVSELTDVVGEQVIEVSYSGFVKTFTVTVKDVPKYKLGDVDRNGKVNVFDASAIQKHLAGIIEFDDEQKALADTDKNGKINIFDASRVQKHIAGIVPEL